MCSNTESFVQLGEPMFTQQFHARLYGPVMVSIHDKYLKDELHEELSAESLAHYRNVFDRVFQVYAPKN